MGPGKKCYLTTLRLDPVGTKTCDSIARWSPHSHQGAPSPRFQGNEFLLSSGVDMGHVCSGK